ncbi:PREDICTED: uncharacterized protein LOC105569219 isoform X2 [Vollenhovia emeryi]|uniref:uncharacterized protein LOC105569219 isoform X2 n=1 Tax=Vollenhovia emeryi TaxID=411798 RepID=UPI0005F3A1EE|nr:PREDICTED: uncharacterized protein LOC105569219 isoform X2 [Vollenhovia emeryi]
MVRTVVPGGEKLNLVVLAAASTTGWCRAPRHTSPASADARSVRRFPPTSQPVRALNPRVIDKGKPRRFNTGLRASDKDCKTGAREKEESVSGTGGTQTRNLGQGSRKTEHLSDVRGIYGRIPNGLGRFGEITNTWRDVKRALSLLCVKKFSGSGTMLEAPPGSREDLVEAARTPCTPTDLDTMLYGYTNSIYVLDHTPESLPVSTIRHVIGHLGTAVIAIPS